jgi:hypothetical protein
LQSSQDEHSATLLTGLLRDEEPLAFFALLAFFTLTMTTLPSPPLPLLLPLTAAVELPVLLV